MLKELIKVIQQEHYTYSDPITEFLECLYVNYDFEGAQEKLRECEEVMPRLHFLGLQLHKASLIQKIQNLHTFYNVLH
jgi:translation initiation factor 3 subunit E